MMPVAIIFAASAIAMVRVSLFTRRPSDATVEKFFGKPDEGVAGASAGGQEDVTSAAAPGGCNPLREGDSRKAATVVKWSGDQAQPRALVNPPGVETVMGSYWSGSHPRKLFI